MPVSSKNNDYATYLEEISPPALRSLPHCATKGITFWELQELGAVLAGDNLPPARYVDCLEQEGVIGAIQAKALPLLARTPDDRLPALAEQWRFQLNVPDGEGLREVLTPIRLLARDAVERQATLFSYARA